MAGRTCVCLLEPGPKKTPCNNRGVQTSHVDRSLQITYPGRIEHVSHSQTIDHIGQLPTQKNQTTDHIDLESPHMCCWSSCDFGRFGHVYETFIRPNSTWQLEATQLVTWQVLILETHVVAVAHHARGAENPQCGAHYIDGL